MWVVELGAVLSASLLGSLHCATMCGPFVAACAADGTSGERRRADVWRTHLSYQGGRGLTYAAAGALLGAAGTALDLAGETVGFVRLAAAVSSVLLILYGLTSLWRRRGGRGPFDGLLRRGLVPLRRKGPTLRGALLGVLTPLLPCGWLYAFLIVAAGSGSALRGALTMLVFWLGSVPALVGVGELVARSSVSLRRRIPVLSSVLLVLVGLTGLVLRVPAFAATETTAPGERVPAPSCH